MKEGSARDIEAQLGDHSKQGKTISKERDIRAVGKEEKADKSADDPELVAMMAQEVVGSHRDYSGGSNNLVSQLEK